MLCMTGVCPIPDKLTVCGYISYNTRAFGAISDLEHSHDEFTVGSRVLWTYLQAAVVVW
jgi:hypothetical protein